MLLDVIASKQVIFFGGKGGVGKTTVSAATALSLANANKRVLLVSTDPAHNLGHLFDRGIGSHIVRLAPNLDGLELDPDQTVNAHLEEISATLRRLMPLELAGEVDKHMELSRDAPGMQEAAILEKIAEVTEQAEQNYDVVIFDTAPSGHTARLMALPEMMSAWTDGLIKRREKADRFKDVVRNLGQDKTVGKKIFGGDDDEQQDDRDQRIWQILHRRKQRFNRLRDLLQDEARTAFIIVLAAERLPVLETIELHQQLTRAGVNVSALVVNKRVPDDSSPFMVERRQQEAAHLDTLTAALPSLPRKDLMLVAHDIVGFKALELFAEQLSE